MQIQAGKKVNNVATISDEAFALLVLENIWEDMLAINIDEYYRPKKKEKTMVMKMKPEGLDKTQIPLVLILQQKTITARL